MDTRDLKSARTLPIAGEKDHWKNLENSMTESLKSLADFEKSGNSLNKDRLLNTDKRVQMSSLDALRLNNGAQCLKIQSDKPRGKSETSDPQGENAEETAKVVSFNRPRADS